MARHSPAIFLFLFLFLVCGSQAFLVAQVTTAAVSGTVKDESGAVIPGMSVSVRNQDTGMTRNVVTDDQGRYSAPDLELGNY